MTLMSAASLSGRGQEASELPFFDGGSTPVPPLPALADLPPRARILVASAEAATVLDLQRALRDGGYRAVGPVASLDEMERLAARRPIDAAILDRQLGAAGERMAGQLAEDCIPFLWLCDPVIGALPRRAVLAPALVRPVTVETLAGALERILPPSRQVSGKAGAGGAAGGEPARHDFYPVPPPVAVWPRVFPTL